MKWAVIIAALALTVAIIYSATLAYSAAKEAASVARETNATWAPIPGLASVIGGLF